MLWKGFCFGLLLQIAIGPICLFIFQVAATRGFIASLWGVLGVSIVDALAIFLSLQGLGLFLEKKLLAQRYLQISGACILLGFGFCLTGEALVLSLLPHLQLQSVASANQIFLYALLLTASNPLTIVFWTGLFSARITQECGKLYLFGLGCVLATVFFLTGIALLGTFIQTILPSAAFSWLNALVGLFLVYCGLRSLFQASGKNFSPK